MAGSVPGLAPWVKDPALPGAGVQVANMAWILNCCGCGCRLAAVAPIHPLAWDPPYATGVALKKKKKHTQKITIYNNAMKLGRQRSSNSVPQ